MEMKTSTVVAALVAAMMLVQTLAIPLGQDVQGNPANLPAEKRPKYMDTRDLSTFKQYLLESVSELIQEGVLSPSVLEKPRPDEQEQEITARKRGHLGLCFRLTPSGNPAARPCWINAWSTFIPMFGKRHCDKCHSSFINWLPFFVGTQLCCLERFCMEYVCGNARKHMSR